MSSVDKTLDRLLEKSPNPGSWLSHPRHLDISTFGPVPDKSGSSRVKSGPAPVKHARTCDITRGVRRQESDCAHEVFRLTHFPLRDEGRPLLLEIGVIVEDLLGPRFQYSSTKDSRVRHWAGLTMR
jgi:hypothetical protein